MKKLAIVALCAAGALSCFFVYKKAFAQGIQVVDYNEYMAQQKQAAVAQERAVQNLFINFQNSTPVAQTVTLRLANGTTMNTTVPSYNPQKVNLPQGAQVVQFSATAFGWPVVLPVDSDLLGKNLSVSIWPMTYAHAEDAPIGAIILGVEDVLTARSNAPGLQYGQADLVRAGEAVPRSSAPIAAAPTPAPAPAPIMTAPMPAAITAPPTFGAIGGLSR